MFGYNTSELCSDLFVCKGTNQENKYQVCVVMSMLNIYLTYVTSYLIIHYDI